MVSKINRAFYNDGVTCIPSKELQKLAEGPIRFDPGEIIYKVRILELFLGSGTVTLSFRGIYDQNERNANRMVQWASSLCMLSIILFEVTLPHIRTYQMNSVKRSVLYYSTFYMTICQRQN